MTIYLEITLKGKIEQFNMISGEGRLDFSIFECHTLIFYAIDNGSQFIIFDFKPTCKSSLKRKYISDYVRAKLYIS